jgi:pyocin large subunit-like protein
MTLLLILSITLFIGHLVVRIEDRPTGSILKPPPSASASVVVVLIQIAASITAAYHAGALEADFNGCTRDSLRRYTSVPASSQASSQGTIAVASVAHWRTLVKPRITCSAKPSGSSPRAMGGLSMRIVAPISS